MVETNLTANLPDFALRCAIVKHLPPKLPFCHKILTECKFLVNHTRGIGKTHSTLLAGTTYVIAHMTLPLFVEHCHVMTLFLVNREAAVTDRACEIAPVGPNCWMHDHSIRPKRRRRASNNTQTPPRKCQELNHQVSQRPGEG